MTTSPRDTIESFVGREELLAEVLDGVRDASAVRGQAWGTWGIGKSWLLREARRRAKLAEALVLFAEASVHVPAAKPGLESDIPLRALYANFRSLVSLIEAMCADKPDLRREVALVVEDASSIVAMKFASERAPITFAPSVEAGGDVAAREEGAIASLFYTEADRPDELCAVILDQVERVVSALARRLDVVAPRKGVLLLIDEFDKLAGHPVERWISSMVARTRRVVAVMVTTDRDGGVGRGGVHLRSMPLPPFTSEEIANYLRLRLGSQLVNSELVAAVHQLTDGLPSAIALVGDLLKQRQARGKPCSLADLPLDEVHDLDLLALVVREVSDPLVRLALRDGRVARRLDRGVVQKIVFGTEGTEYRDNWKQAGAVLERLRRYSFVQPSAGPGVPGGSYRFHRYISQSVDAEGPPEELEIDAEAVHRRLAELWADRIRDVENVYDDSAPRAYADWYVYESPEWQASSLEWLYHAGHVTVPRDRLRARLEFARVFLDAFWWFGCYVRFDFCEHVLDDWERSQPVDDRDLAVEFREVLAGYPLGWRKLDQGDWRRVRAALLRVRNYLELEDKAVLRVPPQGVPLVAAELARLRRLVRAHTSVLLAHSYRYASGSMAQALGYYNDALSLYRSVEGSVCVPWTYFEQADLLLELGRPSEAATHAANALQQVFEEESDDHELLANLHRVRASILIERPGGVPRAVQEAAHAVLRGYAFLVRPHDPDAYTLTFFEEMRERAAELLVHVRDRHGLDTAVDAARLLRDRLAELTNHPALGVPSDDDLRSEISRGSVRPLADLLTPPLPVPEQSETVLAVREVINLVETELDLTAEFPALPATAG